MKKNSTLKNLIKKYLSNSRLYYIYIYIYQFFTNRSGHQTFLKKDSPISNIYVIRPRTNTVEGLMSLFLFVIKNIDYAEKNNYRIYIDFKNYKTQYFIEGENSWDFFFEQPDLPNDDFMTEHSYVLSGYTLKKLKNEKSIVSPEIFFDKKLKNEARRIISTYIKLSVAVKEEFENMCRAYPYINDSIGIYVRGTDYEKLKPVGENIQPEIGDVISKINNFRSKYGKKKIYLVTEDFKKYKVLKDYYLNDLFVIYSDNMIKEYDGKDFLCNSNCLSNDVRKRGMEYFVKILLLTKCRYFISSITKGSIAAYLLKTGEYDDEFIFNLGVY